MEYEYWKQQKLEARERFNEAFAELKSCDYKPKELIRYVSLMSKQVSIVNTEYIKAWKKRYRAWQVKKSKIVCSIL